LLGQSCIANWNEKLYQLNIFGFFKKTVQDRAKEGREEVKMSAVFDLVKDTQPRGTVTDYNNNLEAGSNSGILKMYG
jgi:hypothetical protein